MEASMQGSSSVLELCHYKIADGISSATTQPASTVGCDCCGLKQLLKHFMDLEQWLHDCLFLAGHV